MGRRVPIPSWAEDYEARFGHSIKEFYGIVEVGIQNVQTGERVLGSCGKVLPRYNIRIADDNDAPLPLNILTTCAGRQSECILQWLF